MLDLRTALRLDALASGSLGVGLIALSGLLDGPLGLPMPLSLAVGGLLLAWAGLVAWASVRPSAPVVKEIVALNIGYVALSVVFAVSGWVHLTGIGVAFVLLQAGAVVGLVAMQVVGLRAARTNLVPAS